MVKSGKPTISIHPAAGIFPMLSDDEMKELTGSIVRYGLREKIVAIPEVHPDRTDWTVVDGRNRLEALRKAGVKDEEIIASFIQPMTFDGLPYTVEEYVMMANIDRRNLSAPQRRALAGKLAIMLAEAQKDKPKEAQEDTLAIAATKAGVSRRTAAYAKQTALEHAGKTPAKKKTAAKPTPARPISIQSKIQSSFMAIKDHGHNWPLGNLKNVRELIDGLLPKLDELILSKEADEATKQADAAAKEASKTE